MEESATIGREDASSILTPGIVAPHTVEQTKSGLDGDGGRGFGLGVGLTLTPEFAQKVRERRGTGTGPPVDPSGLTFLKGSSVSDTSQDGRIGDSETPVTSAPSTAERSSISGESEELGEERTALEPVAAGEVVVNGSSGPREEAESNPPEGTSGPTVPAHGRDSSDAIPDAGGDGGGVAAEGGDAVHATGAREASGGADSAVAEKTPDSWEDLDVGAGADGATLPTVRKGRTARGATGGSAQRVPGGKRNRRGGVRRKKEATKKKVEQSRPVLLVDLARLCGFRVRAAEEAAVMGSKIRTVLHESFRERSEELFETGSAVHADTSSLKEELHRRQEASASKSFWAVVDYPDKVDGVSTEEAWGVVATPSSYPAVECIRRALALTSRHLAWKRDMLEQLEAVAQKETEAREAREMEERTEALEAWRANRRERLEKLIEIRPMFERRRAMAAEKLLLAAEEAGELPAEDSVADPVAAAVVRSVDAKLDTIDDLIARLEIEEGEEGKGFVPSDEDGEHDGDDAYEFAGDFPPEQMEHLGMEGLSGGGVGVARGVSERTTDGEPAKYNGGVVESGGEFGGAKEAPGTPVQKEGDHGAAKVAGPTMVTKVRQKKPGAKRRSVVEQLRDKQAQREGDARGSSKEEQGGVARGETEGDDSSGARGQDEGDGVIGHGGGGEGKKRGDVDGVEGGDTATIAPVEQRDATNVASEKAKEKEEEAEQGVPDQMTLVDAVAAMILGRFPKDPGATDEEHCGRIAAMHQEMKDAWMREYGRLPSMPGSSSTGNT